jgi:hypothetical protein
MRKWKYNVETETKEGRKIYKEEEKEIRRKDNTAAQIAERKMP